MTLVGGRELDVEGTSDKTHKGCHRERISKKMKSYLVISWLGTGVDKELRMNSSEPMVGCVITQFVLSQSPRKVDTKLV
jgi:hypothetical protein